MIQKQWHAYKARQFMMNAVRAQYTVKTDPLTGRLMYTNVHTHAGFKNRLVRARANWIPRT